VAFSEKAGPAPSVKEERSRRLFQQRKDNRKFHAGRAFFYESAEGRRPEADCYAWAFLDNHFHLLLKPKTSTLAAFMRRLLTGYSVTFNLRHTRSVHLFQNRYKSIGCDKDPYLLAGC
jgi:hypothetical protein